jgi:putative FmdB family regulatory protein
MPTYQYACTNAECGHRFEQVQSFTDAAISDCPQCADRLRKVYGSVGVVFKGSGFYRTDSREAKTAAAPAKADSGSSDSAPSTSTGNDTKSSGSDSSSSSSSTSSSSSSSSATPAAKPTPAAV